MNFREIMNVVNESFGQDIRQINISEDYGDVDGYIVSSAAEQLPNWLAKHGIYDEKIINKIRSKFPLIAFLDNLNVNDDSRGEGNGSYLLDSFIEEAILADAILLIADTGETNEFDLVQWYKSRGFRTLVQTASGPLMLLAK